MILSGKENEYFMRKAMLKNSKKGLTLPVAVVISTVLVILAAGLIFIALSSLSVTTSTVNGRQAYVNVKSALEYAQSYYHHKVDGDYDNIGVAVTGAGTVAGQRIEYIAVKENNTNGETFYLRGDASVIEGCDTWVTAEYLPPEGSESAHLRLTGYGNYSDSFGNRGKMVILSVIFDIGAAGAQNRVTVLSVPTPDGIPSDSDTINLNLKLPAELEWNVCYYIWTYQEFANSDSSRATYNKPYDSNINFRDNTTKKNLCYVYDSSHNRINPNVHDLSYAVWKGNIKTPNGAWVGKQNNGTGGATGLMVKRSNGWFAGSYKINKQYVNFFNVIFAKHGATIQQSGYYDSQSEEIFHLWYLNSDDKNIYFEFLNNKKTEGGREYYIKYNYVREGWDWNGRDYLDDTVLVYLKNQKTTVHFRADNDNAEFVGTSAPSGYHVYIDQVQNSSGAAIGADNAPTFLKSSGENQECNIAKQTTGIEMIYEGCGWWVANIETRKNFDIKITYTKPTGTYTSTLTNVKPYIDSGVPDSVAESWLVMKSGDLEAHQSERSALRSVGAAETYYVTVHAKAYEPDITASPKLTYKYSLLNSSTGREELYQKIAEASLLKKSDYSNYDNFTNASGQDISLAKVLNDAITAYNDAAFINNQPGATNSEKIAAANTAYRAHITNIDFAIEHLTPAIADEDTLNSLREKVQEGDRVVASWQYYDVTKYNTFVQAETTRPDGTVVPDGAYQQAKKMLSRGDVRTNVEVENATTALTTALETVQTGWFDRDKLSRLLEDSNTLKDDNTYTLAARTEFANKLPAIRTVYDTVPQTKLNFDNAIAALEAAIEELKRNKVYQLPPEDFANINAAIAQAQALLDSLLPERTSTTLTDSTVYYVSTPKSQLETLLNGVEAVKQAATERTTIDEEEAKIKLAMDRTVVNKPADTNLDLDVKHILRVWFEIPSADYNTKIYTISKTTTEGDVISTSHNTSEGLIKALAGTQYYYFDADKSTVSKVKLTVTNADGSTVIAESPEIDLASVTDNNLFIVPASETQLTAQKMTTLYIPSEYYPTSDSIEHKNYQQITIKVNGEGVNAPAQGNYRVLKYKADPSAGVSIDIGYEGTLAGSVQHTAFLTFSVASAGDYILRMVGSNLEVINVNEIYPQYDPTAPAQPDVQPEVSNGQEYSIRPLATAEEQTAAAQKIAQLTQVSTNINDATAAGNSVIILDADGVSDFNSSVKPYIYIWKNGSSREQNSWDHRQQMLQVPGTNFYYHIVQPEFNRMIITRNNNDDNAKYTSGDTALNGAAPTYYYYTKSKEVIICTLNDVAAAGGYTPPTVDPDPDDDTADFDSSVEYNQDLSFTATISEEKVENIPMAYVGGGKIRIKNKSYVTTYGEGQMGNEAACDPYENAPDSTQLLKNGWLFGGKSTGESGSEYYESRVGDAMLLPYYDWYEYKIPLEQSNIYTLQIEGLANKSHPSAKTPAIQNVFGDVWINLFNDTLTSGLLNETEVMTFDSDKYQVGSTFAIYFQKPNNTTTTYGSGNKAISTWSKPKLVEAYGVGTPKTADMTQLTRSTNRDKYMVDGISKRTLFFKLAVTETITYKNADDTLDTTKGINGIEKINHIYLTKYQGGNKVLFNPTLNNGYGGWETFTSDYDRLIEVCDSLLNLYYAKTLVNKYDDSGNVIVEYDGTNPKPNPGPEYIYSIIDQKLYFSRSDGNSNDAYKTDSDKIKALTETQAYNVAESLEDILELYSNLYSQMALARSYIADPASGGKYPEYLNRGTTREYTDSWVTSLKSKLAEAESAYKSTSGSNMSSALQNLNRVLANVEVSEEGSIAVILFDAQEKTKQIPAHRFRLEYKDSHGTAQQKEVTEYNLEGYPIYFVKNEAQITDVEFYDLTVGKYVGIVNSGGVEKHTKKDVMKKNEAWVLMDTKNPFWRQNSYTDFRQLNGDEYVQTASGDTLQFQMKYESGSTTTFEPMTVYFRYDTKIKRLGAAEYTVKAGAYTFRDADTKPTGKPVIQGGLLDLFSAEAAAYFTQSANYGRYTDNGTGGTPSDATTLGWYSGNAFMTGVGRTVSGNVNFEIPEEAPNTTPAAFTGLSPTRSYSYSTNGGLNFRWSSKKPLYLKSSVEMHVSELKFAAVGEIDSFTYGTTNTGFYIYNSRGLDEMTVEFMTDVTIKYKDARGAARSFVIHEGKYLLKKAPIAEGSDVKTDYIANLFNETYWKNMVYVIPISPNGNDNMSGNTGGGLSHPTYGYPAND